MSANQRPAVRLPAVLEPPLDRDVRIAERTRPLRATPLHRALTERASQ
jgi:hypothetical protein